MSDLDLRLVRYFTVVAEHGNFGRAAAALHVAQPSLSRQVQRLEDQLGLRLFERTPQGSRLTAAGEAFLVRARQLLKGAQDAVAEARAAVRTRVITIGYAEDFVVTAAVRDLRHRHPGAPIRTLHLDWDDATALVERRVDALVARMPFLRPADELRVTTLYEEPRVLVVPRFHRLAGKESVTIGDFSGEARVPCAQAPGEWREFWRLNGEGRPAPAGPVLIESYEDKLELIAQGDAIAILPAGDRRIGLREDLTTVPIEGIEPCRVVVATRADDHDPLVTDFHESARAHLIAA